MGAWLGGVAMLTPGTRTGPSLPLVVGAAGALGVALGAIDHPVLLVAAAALYAFTLTFIGSVSHVAGVTFTVSGIMFFLADHLTAGTGVLLAALAVAAGGAVQAAMSLLPPYYRWAEDRRTLADAWLALAAEADALAADPNAPFRTEPLLEAARELDRRRALPAAVHEARRQIYAVSTAMGATLPRAPAPTRRTATPSSSTPRRSNSPRGSSSTSPSRSPPATRPNWTGTRSSTASRRTRWRPRRARCRARSAASCARSTTPAGSPSASPPAARTSSPTRPSRTPRAPPGRRSASCGPACTAATP